MNLQQALEQIASDFDLDAAKLADYAAQDKYTGWDNDKGQFPVGSLWEVEGRVLYALIRLLKPKSVLELGVNYGASTCHIASALQKSRSGKVISVDVAESAGSMIPTSLSKYVELRYSDGIEALKRIRKNSLDFIFEDMGHSYEAAKKVAELAPVKLKPGGLLVVHDAMHFLVGADIRNGLQDGGLEPKYYEIAPSDCGLAIWQKSEDTND